MSVLPYEFRGPPYWYNFVQKHKEHKKAVSPTGTLLPPSVINIVHLVPKLLRGEARLRDNTNLSLII